MDSVREIVGKPDVHLLIKTYVVDTSGGDLSSAPHFHPELEFIYVLDGAAHFTIEGTRVRVPAGQILLINGMTGHASEMEGYTRLCLLQFDLQLVADLCAGSFAYFSGLLQRQVRYVIIDADREECRALPRLLLDISEEFAAKRVAYEFMILSRLCELFTLLCRTRLLQDDGGHRYQPGSSDRFAAILQFLGAHFRDEIDGAALARRFHLDPCYFCHLFKQRTGRTFTQYRNHLRIEAAKQALADPACTVTEAMLAAGMRDPSYFCRLFKAQTGYAPAAYRASLHA